MKFCCQLKQELDGKNNSNKDPTGPLSFDISFLFSVFQLVHYYFLLCVLSVLAHLLPVTFWRDMIPCSYYSCWADCCLGMFYFILCYSWITFLERILKNNLLAKTFIKVCSIISTLIIPAPCISETCIRDRTQCFHILFFLNYNFSYFLF